MMNKEGIYLSHHNWASKDYLEIKETAHILRILSRQFCLHNIKQNILPHKNILPYEDD